MGKDGKNTILIVDDIAENVDVLNEILKDSYHIKVATNGKIALKVVNQEPPDLILLDVMMPEIDGYEVIRELKSDIRLRNIPVIFVTAKGEVVDEAMGFALGAVDYITKPISPAIVTARVKTHLTLYDQKRLLEDQVKERTKEIHETRLMIIQRLGRAAEYKDNETGMHVIRMSHYSRIIAQEMKLKKSEIDIVFNAAPMHDIGKIGIPDHILLKPGKLDGDEWNIMRTHSQIGSEIIGDHDSILLKSAKIATFTHHEK